MLERLRIQNFQSHHKLDIQLDPAVTTLIGPSDVGKSAVLRAFRWLATNRPRGDAFIRDGADRVSVKARVDGQNVTRRRGPAGNEYIVDGASLKALERTCPNRSGTC